MFVRPGIISGILLLAAACVALAADKPAGDWPCWRGPNRDAVSTETGLLISWPAKGPTLLWTADDLGNGHCTPSVANGRVFGLGDRGDDEVVWALDAASGKELWHCRIAGTKREIKLDPNLPPRGQKQPNRLDPRSTPAIADGRVYALGIMGDLVCLDAKTGKLQWQCNLVKDLGGAMHYHGYAESPLIEGDLVIVSPGGPDATIVALDKNTGKKVWSSAIPGDRSQYSSAIVGEVERRRMIIQFLEKGVVGVDPRDGKMLWRFDRPKGATYSIATPIFHDGYVFVSESSGGSILARIALKEQRLTATTEYTSTRMRNQHGGMVLVDGHVYGCNGEVLTCVEFMTGKELWSERCVGKGSIIAAGGHLYIRGERGGVALVEASSKEYIEKGRFTPPKRSGANSWAHPVIAGGRLYLRDQNLLFCYDIKEAK